MQSDRGDILLAEEEAPTRAVHGRELRKAGFTVFDVGAALEAVDALETRRFDLLLADIEMPGNANLELLNFLRTRGAPLPVVLMTSVPSVDSAVEALRYGVADYVTKPLDLDSLPRRLDQAIHKGRAQDALTHVRKIAVAFAESVAALEAVLGATAAKPAGAVPAPSSNPLAKMGASDVARLSRRELEVARLLARGKPVGEVASVLQLSPNTVRNHVKSVFIKLRVHSQVELLSKLVDGEP